MTISAYLLDSSQPILPTHNTLKVSVLSLVKTMEEAITRAHRTFKTKFKFQHQGQRASPKDCIHALLTGVPVQSPVSHGALGLPGATSMNKAK